MLQTDQAFLTLFLSFRNLEDQMARWVRQLQEYDFEIQHRERTIHGNAVVLSRKPCNESCRYYFRVEKKHEAINPMARQVMAPSTSKPDPRSNEGLREVQKEDPDLKPILEFKEFSSV